MKQTKSRFTWFRQLCRAWKEKKSAAKLYTGNHLLTRRVIKEAGVVHFIRAEGAFACVF